MTKMQNHRKIVVITGVSKGLGLAMVDEVANLSQA